MTDHPLRQRIAAVLDLAPDESAIEYDGQWFSYRQVGTLARRIATLVNDRGQVGILLRNRPAHVAAFLGVLMAGGTVVVINPSRGDDRTKADIAALELAVIIGDSDDLTNLVGQAAGSTVISISALDADPDVTVMRRTWRCRQTRCRGADVDQRYDRPAEADRSHLRHVGAQRDGSRTGPVPVAKGSPQRRRDRERTACAHRRRVPGAAMHR